MKWIEKPCLPCIPLCFGVCLSFFCFFFLALLHDHCYSLYTRRDSLQTTKSRLVISVWLQSPGPVATKMPVFLPKFKSSTNFSSSSPRGKPLFPLWEITRHFAQSARRGAEKTQLPTLLSVGPTMLGVECSHLRPCCHGVFPVWSIKIQEHVNAQLQEK